MRRTGNWQRQGIHSEVLAEKLYGTEAGNTRFPSGGSRRDPLTGSTARQIVDDRLRGNPGGLTPEVELHPARMAPEHAVAHGIAVRIETHGLQPSAYVARNIR